MKRLCILILTLSLNGCSLLTPPDCVDVEGVGPLAGELLVELETYYREDQTLTPNALELRLGAIYQLRERLEITEEP